MKHIEEQIVRLDEEIVRHLESYRKQFELLQTIPGIGENASAAVLAEIGPDMSPFEDDGKLASWAGICPGNNESGGKKLSSNTRKGNLHLVSTLVESAWASTHAKNCQFKNRYHRIRSRRGPQRAIVGVAHALLRTIYVVLKTGEPYREPLRPQLTENRRNRKADRLTRELRSLGYDVVVRIKTA